MLGFSIDCQYTIRSLNKMLVGQFCGTKLTTLSSKPFVHILKWYGIIWRKPENCHGINEGHHDTWCKCFAAFPIQPIKV